MTSLFKIEHNAETGELLRIELTAQELQQIANERVRAEEALTAQAEAEAAKAAAQAKLAALGLTTDDLKALGL